jgi:hypothetical protein
MIFVQTNDQQEKRRLLMKKLILLFSILVLVVGPAWAKNYEITKKVEDYTVKIEIDKNPPVVGNNNLSITVQDASGKNITDAKIKIEYSMPPMAGMPPSKYKAEGILSGSAYKSKLDFSMAGGWNLDVQITRADKVKKLKFTVDVK